MKHTFSFVVALMMLTQVSGAAETNLAFKTFIKDVLLREDDPNKNREIVEYAQRSGIDTQQVTRVLEGILNETLDSEESESERYVLSKMTIDALGKLGNLDSLPLLAKASKTKDKNRRIGAISAYVKVARENSISFAKDIMADPNQYGTMERYILYQRLAEHAQKTEDTTVDVKRKPVRRFLMDAVQTESDPDAAKKLDQVLSTAIPIYKTSQQREAMAKRFLDAKVPVFREYFKNVLAELGNIPASNKTDVSKDQSL